MKNRKWGWDLFNVGTHLSDRQIRLEGLLACRFGVSIQFSSGCQLPIQASAQKPPGCQLNVMFFEKGAWYELRELRDQISPKRETNPIFGILERPEELAGVLTGQETSYP